MRWPVRGRVISNYGSGSGKSNDGIDIAVPEGTPVKAAENGVVIYAGDGLKEFGNTVLVRHENGLVTVYGHASSIEVKRGEKVKRGQEIALSGMSGTTDCAEAALRSAQEFGAGRSVDLEYRAISNRIKKANSGPSDLQSGPPAQPVRKGRAFSIGRRRCRRGFVKTIFPKSLVCLALFLHPPGDRPVQVGRGGDRAPAASDCGWSSTSAVLPCSTMRPSCMTITSSVMARATVRSWVMNR